MLAQQAASEIQFPFLGSRAIWNGEPCRIVQCNRDGSFIVSNETFRRIAQRSELVDPATVTLTPFGAWAAARIDRLPELSDDGTGIDDLYDDYLAWVKAAELSADPPLKRVAFAGAMHNSGFRPVMVSNRALYSARPIHQRGFAVALRQVGRL